MKRSLHLSVGSLLLLAAIQVFAAVKTPLQNPVAYENRPQDWQWSLAQGDTANPIAISNQGDMTIQVSGTFGGAGITLQGSNEPAATNGIALHDIDGNAINLTAAGVLQVKEKTLFLWPVISGGNGTTNLTITIFGR
jgi:hypothetical protein